MDMRSGSRSFAPRPGPPPETLERDPAPAVEGDALFLQTHPLYVVVRTISTLADSTLRVHDTMPRQTTASRQCRKRVANQPRLSVKACQLRHLSVCRDAPTRHARHDRIDAPKRSVRPIHCSMTSPRVRPGGSRGSLFHP